MNKLKRIYEVIDEMFSDDSIENICQSDRKDLNVLRGRIKRKINTIFKEKLK